MHAFKGYGINPSQCRVRVFRDPNGLVMFGDEKYVVVLTELGIGTSVTNAAEQIATDVLYLIVGRVTHGDVDAARQSITWFEHYPERGDKHERILEVFDFISFRAFDDCGPYYARGPENRGFSGTEWRRASRMLLEQLIGGSFK